MASISPPTSNSCDSGQLAQPSCPTAAATGLSQPPPMLDDHIELQESPVAKTELCYVTTVNEEEGTFFAQLCKNTNEDLINYNKKIQEYCKSIFEEARLPTLTDQDIRIGDVLCARYKVDSFWYRVIVKAVHPTQRECKVAFVDYGNIEMVPFEHLIRPVRADLPMVNSHPFGINCIMEDWEHYSQKKKTNMLECLREEYVIIKTLKRLSKNHWLVGIPKLAYNTSFWISYKKCADIDEQRA